MIPHEFLDPILQRYGLADAETSPANQGDDNLTSFIGTPGPRFVLRRYQTTPAAEIDFELNLIDHLVESGFPTPAIVRTTSGDRRVEHAGTHAVMFEFFAGTPIDPQHPGSRAQVAELAARLHLATVGLAFDGERSRSDQGRIRSLLAELESGEGLALKAGADRLTADLRALLSELDGVRELGLPVGAVHHDYFHENVLVGRHDQNAQALIDFDESYAGPLVFDIAALLTEWATDDEDRFDGEAARAVLAAYERVRPITPAERTALPLAVRTFNAADAAEYIQRNHRKRPAEFEIAQCRSLQTYHALTGHNDWRRELGAAGTP